MIKKVFWATILVVLLCSFNLNAQKKNTLIQGKVFEDATNQPLTATLVFFSESGNFIKIKSNGFDGSYQGVIENGHRYSISATDWLIVKPQRYMETPGKEDYLELTWQFRLKKMETGQELNSANAFDPGIATLAGDYIKALTSALGFLEANPNAFVVIEVSSEDTYFQPKSEKREIIDKKGKAKMGTVKIGVEEQIQKLLDDRIASLSKYLERFKKYNRRIQFEKITKPGVKPKVVKQKKKSQSTEPEKNTPVNNIKVKIGKIIKI